MYTVLRGECEKVHETRSKNRGFGDERKRGCW